MNIKHYYLLALFVGLLAFTGCEDNTDPDLNIDETDYSLLLNDYVSSTIVPTYADMKDNAILLFESVSAFQNSLSQTDLDSACINWKETRAPWERSEAFLFGPAAYNSLDPQLDSWPLDQAQLNQVLEGNQELTATFVREGLGNVLRGFHAVEYLLFRDGENRTAANFTDREIAYLVGVSQVLRDDCITLWALWDGVEAGSFEAGVLEELDIEIATPYKNEFINAGKSGSRYTAQRDALDEIIQGIIDIADEVANGKLADPYTTKDVYVVESWHSWNSLTDFKNNIVSIQNAYSSAYAGVDGTHSLSGLVAEKDAELDQTVKATIANALLALDKIQEPYRNNLNDEVNIPAAMDAINAIFSVFDEEVRALLLD